MSQLNRIMGSIVGGAVGDALGYAVEFLSARSIFKEYGDNGITEYDLYNGEAIISDDTQMTLFTASGLLTGISKNILEENALLDNLEHNISDSYKGWYATQTENFFNSRKRNYSWLENLPELYSRRAPGNTCLSAISQGANGTMENPLNNSCGCGGVMRVAPIGLVFTDSSFDIRDIDILGAKAAALTHGHEFGYIPAAMLVHILQRIIRYNDSILDAVNDALLTIPDLFPNSKSMKKFLDLIKKAVKLSTLKINDLKAIRQLGEGWTGEETLAIAVYCSLKYSSDFEKGIIAAVNHDGDSDSTGAVTGNILGASLGIKNIPPKFIDDLELFNLLIEISEDLYNGSQLTKEEILKDSWNKKYVDIH